MKRTNVAALAGRVIESATIHHGDNEEPLGIEIRCVGGLYFSFDVGAEIRVCASTFLADNRTGNFRNKRRRKFYAMAVAPKSVEDWDFDNED